VLTQPSGRVVTRAELFSATSDALGEIDAAIRELVRGGYLPAARPKRRGRHASSKEGGRTRPDPRTSEGSSNAHRNSVRFVS
jgi:hypothetical protein